MLRVFRFARGVAWYLESLRVCGVRYCGAVSFRKLTENFAYEDPRNYCGEARESIEVKGVHCTDTKIWQWKWKSQ